MHGAPILSGRRVLVVASTFPNRIQPWMLNTTIQVLRQGAEVFVAAGSKRDRAHQASATEYRLHERTIYVQPTSYQGLLYPLRYLLGSSQELRRAARTGLVRAITRPSSIKPREIVKAITLAVPIGLRQLDLVHAHSMALGYEFLRVAKAHKVPLVQTFHGGQPAGASELAASKMRWLFRWAACILVNTDAARQQLVNRGCPANKILILPQGTNLAEFPFAPRPYPSNGRLEFLSVGRLHEDKGHVFAMRALSKLASKDLDFSYRIVGTGPLRTSLEEQAVHLGIADRITFVGEVYGNELRREYRQAHILLFPSVRDEQGNREETQGVAIQEAQASGCVVIATRTGGVPESVDERCVQLVPDRDPDALAAAVRRVMEQPERWRDWQEAGRHWVEQRYAVEVIGHRLAEIYQQVLDRS